MSLINDALQRTQDVQQQTAPTASGPALRPADPAQAKAASGARTLLFIMVAAVILGNFLLWMAFKDRDEQKPGAPAAAPVQAQAAPAPAVAPEPPVEPVPTQAAVASPLTEPESNPEAATVATLVQEAPTSAVATNTPEPESKVVFVEPPKPTVLRLQSIIYGSRPSAMIAGKFLFIGDSIQGHKVIAIDRETVTLVGEGQTNVLSLP